VGPPTADRRNNIKPVFHASGKRVCCLRKATSSQLYSSSVKRLPGSFTSASGKFCFNELPLGNKFYSSSINLLGSTGLLPIGFGLTGWATDHFGPAVVFVIGGVLTAGLAALGLIHPAIRALE
jgi:hypothetical protein